MKALQTTTFAGQTIASPLAVATYTALADHELLAHVYLSGLAGNGNYRACLTKRRGGAGTIFQGATAAIPVASGVTTAWLETLALPVATGDVVTVWVQGLAGDASVGVITDVFDLAAVNVTMQAGVAVAAADVNGNVPVVLYGTQPAVEFGKVKITATGNDTALSLTGAGSGKGMYIKGGLTGSGLQIEDGATGGVAALYIVSPNGQAVNVNAGAVGVNISGNSLNQDFSTIDIYNDGYSGSADVIRIDHVMGPTVGGNAVSIRNNGTEPALKIEAYATGAGIQIITADGDGLVISAGGVGHYDINADIHGTVDGNIPLTAQETANAVNDLAPAGASGATGSIRAKLDIIDSNVDTLVAVDTSTTDATTAGSISRRRGNSWAIPLTLGAITGYTSLWFTIKSSHDDADTAALVQIKDNASGLLDGLLYVNGATASDATKGSITVSDATTGAIVITLDETITDDLAPGTYYYDVQTLIASAVGTPDSGTFEVTADVTRSVT